LVGSHSTTPREEELGKYACYEANSGGKTQAVGRKKPNGLGLYDMSGNVFEWLQDCWNESYSGAPSDGGPWESGECGRRVIRGGSWYVTAEFLRASFRRGVFAVYRHSFIGFRLAQDID
jgi:formylglycine-generating enzyme required for sulfatase activity